MKGSGEIQSGKENTKLFKFEDKEFPYSYHECHDHSFTHAKRNLIFHFRCIGYQNDKGQTLSILIPVLTSVEIAGWKKTVFPGWDSSNILSNPDNLNEDPTREDFRTQIRGILNQIEAQNK